MRVPNSILGSIAGVGVLGLAFLSFQPTLVTATDTTSTLSGVKVETITPGDGITFPQKGDTVSMHYVGTLLANGQQFDSSRDRNSVFKTQIGVGAVIKGWDQGVPQMSLGEKANLIIGSDFGYGKRGAGGAIPPNADLKFEVELLKINNKAAVPRTELKK